MSNPVTVPTDASVSGFIAQVEPEARREGAKALDAIFRRVTGDEPQMWGASIIGYGDYHTTYDSGRKVHWLRTGFSSRKAKHSLYLMGGYCDAPTGRRMDALREKLGPHSKGASCLYVTRLERVDEDALEEMIRLSWDAMNRLYPPDG
ncbi:DUF1801 domain-containing protein [Aurantiacibacter aquimixticola]|uniref:DUF1801 domain-containing protein n=1 Tax=Aurantiacibacter aquimixticola TaxID=1958945 RepID=A0A419RWR7_9SPHN|nr:DUF1801 domain-containing protein [Aurantiacibacter aquimixticola]RJY10214.1 DUF1801 domain-containing protein [Aurantiacibacter aquimixticola]